VLMRNLGGGGGCRCSVTVILSGSRRSRSRYGRPDSCDEYPACGVRVGVTASVWQAGAGRVRVKLCQNDER
jgi:hypothetical protein